jgi:hypothetical protein
MHDPVQAARERSVEHVTLGDITADDLHIGIGVGLEVDDADMRAGATQV